jgi:hypothetical protein
MQLHFMNITTNKKRRGAWLKAKSWSRIDGNEKTLGSGDVAIIRPSTPHSARTRTASRAIVTTFRFVMNYLGWHIRFTELISDALQSARRREVSHSNGRYAYVRFATMTFCFSPGTSSMNSVTEKCGCQCRCAYASGIHVSP